VAFSDLASQNTEPSATSLLFFKLSPQKSGHLAGKTLWPFGNWIALSTARQGAGGKSEYAVSVPARKEASPKSKVKPISPEFYFRHRKVSGGQ
jgi:hypothetical protein